MIIDYVAIDVTVKALNLIDVVHYKVHQGDFYSVSDYDSDVDILSPKYWHIKTPDTSVRFHVSIKVSGSLAGLVDFFENPTLSNDGTSLTPNNNNRNSVKTSSLSFYYDPTVSNDGTNQPASKIGGGVRTGSEFILKQNMSYIVKFTPAADNTAVSFTCEFYEVA